MSLIFKSYQRILGDMIRKLMAMSGISDLNKGSVVMTMLEAVAQEVFAQYGSLIKVLDNFSLDNLSGIDLDNKAQEYSKERLSALPSSGFVKITDTSFDKIFSTVYIGATPPVAGDTVINVADASDFPSSAPYGALYLGRGTSNLEGPISINGAPVNHVTYWSIPISTPLAKNHNLGETVILAQGGARTIATGTIASIPANNVSPSVSFRVVSSVTIEDGENVIENVLVAATTPGVIGNAPLRAINRFNSPPFAGASVSNEYVFSNGRDLETDQELRERIKDYIQSISKGTALAIISGIIGTVDIAENKRVASATLLEPTAVTDIARLYIDDGSGFEPTYAGKGNEDVLLDALGNEKFLQLGNYPLVKAQVESINESPFELSNGDFLQVQVNNELETIVFNSNYFNDITLATAIEIAEFINDNSTLIEARTSDNHKKVVIFAKAINNESITVVGGTANSILRFPTDTIYTLKLYKNDDLLSKDGETAFLESSDYDEWASFTAPYTLTLSVDGGPTQHIEVANTYIKVSYDGTNWVTVSPSTTFDDLGVTVESASIGNWAVVLQQAINGATVMVNGDKLRITSNIEESVISQLEILGGTLVTSQGWSTSLVQGQASDYTLNRWNGQIELASPLAVGDNINVSSADTRASIKSVSNTRFDLQLLVGRSPIVIMTVDGYSIVKTIPLATNDEIAVSNTGGDTWRYKNNNSASCFDNLDIGDYIYIVNRTAGGGYPAWIGSQNTGLYRVVDTGLDGGKSYFDVINPQGAPVTGNILDSKDIQAFYSDVPPQIIEFVAGLILPEDVASDINNKIIGAIATTSDNNEIVITTNTYDSLGSIHVVGVIGNAVNLGFSTDRDSNITSHFASLVSNNQLGIRIPEQFGETTSNDIIVPYTTIVDSNRVFINPLTQQNQWVKFISQVGLSASHDSDNCVNKDIKGIINSIFGSDTIVLRNPVLLGLNDKDILNTIPIGAKYYQFYPFDFDEDNLVFVMDNDAANKTYNIPLHRSGQVTASTSVNDFDADDVDSNINTSFGDLLWDGYDFSDYKIWMQARNVIDPSGADNGMIFRAIKFGTSGETIRVTAVYPEEANVSLGVDLDSSGSLVRPTTQDDTTQFDITYPSDGVTRYTWDGTGSDPSFSEVSIGDLAYFNSTNFNYVNNGWGRIIDKDAGNAWIEVSKVGYAETNKTLGATSAMIIYSNIGASTFTITLASGNERATTHASDTEFDITLPGGGVTRYTWIGGTNPTLSLVSIGDVVTFDSGNFNAANNGTFKISNKDGGNTWIEVINLGFAETKTLGDDEAMSIYPLSGNTATAIKDLINNDEIASEMLSVVLGTGITGTGSVDFSFEDDPSIGSEFVYMIDGENYVSSFQNISPQFALKKSLSFITVGTIYDITTAPNLDGSLGEKIKLIPVTAKNIIDHLNKPTISAISSNAVVERSNKGDQIQVSSKLMGSQGMVEAQDSSGNSSLALSKDSASIDGASLKTSILSTQAAGFHVGQMVKITNPNVMKKRNTFGVTTQVTVNSINSLIQKYTLEHRPLGITTPTDSIDVTEITPNKIYKLEFAGGSTGTFGSCKAGDELQVGAGSAFNSGNIGNFPIVYVDTLGTYIYVINPSGFAEAGVILAASSDLRVATPFFTQWKLQSDYTTEMAIEFLSQDIYRCRWTGTGSNPKFLSGGMKLEDYISIAGSQFSANNRGLFRVIGLGEDYFEIYNPNGSEETVTLGESILSSASIGFNVIISTPTADTVTYSLVSGNWLNQPKNNDILTVPATSPFNAANQGSFLVLTSTSNSITVYSPAGGFVETAALVDTGDITYENSLKGFAINSTFENDSLYIGEFVSAGWFDEANQGQLLITEVGRTDVVNSHYVKVSNGTVKAETVTLAAFIDNFYILSSDLYDSYRKITNIAINQNDSNYTFIYFMNNSNDPIVNYNKIGFSFSSQFNALNKLGFSTVPTVGIDGYKYWTGLLRTVQRKVDGYSPDNLTYPGLKAAGVQVDILPPLLKQVEIAVDVRPSKGVPLSIISNSIKSAILAYISSLGVGEDVVLSQVVKKVQEVPGVDAVRIMSPSPDNDVPPERIVISDNEKAISFEDLISVG